MATLRDDLFTRGRPTRRRVPVSGVHCALIFVAVALLVLARLEHPMVRALQAQLNTTAAPVLAGARQVMIPVEAVWRRAHLVFYGDEAFEKMRREIVRLREVEHFARQNNARLSQLERAARLVQRQVGKQTVTARVLAGSGGVFRRSLLIEGGTRDGVYDGFPVYDGGGLIGRTIDVTDDTARVLLLSDANSRVPVHIGTGMHRALLAGNGSSRPRLLFVPRSVEVKLGDRVETSGAAGVFPAGLHVGEIVEDAGGLRVRLFAGVTPQRFVTVHQFAGPGARLTGFLAAKAFERKLDTNRHQASRRKPVAGRATNKPVSEVSDGGQAVVR